MAIALARRCEAIIVGICVIYAPLELNLEEGWQWKKTPMKK